MGRVLVVDDDPRFRRMLADILADVGHDVQEADSGAVALGAVEASIPDVVCLDLWMDGMSGLEVLERLTREHPGLPVIVVTADPLTDTIERVRARGAFDYILKPFDAERIQRPVDAAIARRRRAP